MSGRPASVDPCFAVGLPVREAAEIVYDEDRAAVALQLTFADDSSLVCTVWTDWTLVIEKRADNRVPEYFWPPTAFSVRTILPGPDLEVVSASLSRDEVGEVMGADFLIGGRRITVRSFGGEVDIAVMGGPRRREPASPTAQTSDDQ
ncbi:hypothetical protein [Lentzea sp.]|uniref:hypothetical protein n=1 Tax=Lentzea sp. TaxID=56099 RepID=UPI002BA4AD83|nr:hypothetical protein [Lentzea sp.]HUQ59095.1 hypothetical protein [Lentzea sp.]